MSIDVNNDTSLAFVFPRGFSWNSYMNIVITGFGTFTNSLNVLVLLSPKLVVDVRYKYMLWKSVTNLVYVALSLLNELLLNCQSCAHSSTYASMVYSITVAYYLCGCLAVFRILIEVYISAYTYSILNSRNNPARWNRMPQKFVLVGLFIISLVFFLFRPFSMKASLVSPGHYILSYNSFGMSFAYRFISISLSLVKLFLTTLVLTSINVLNSFRLKEWVKSRQRATAIYISNTNNPRLSYHNFLIELRKLIV